MKKEEILTYFIGFGLMFLYGWLLNIVPNINGSTVGINWKIGTCIGWIFGWFTATLIYERRKDK